MNGKLQFFIKIGCLCVGTDLPYVHVCGMEYFWFHTAFHNGVHNIARILRRARSMNAYLQNDPHS